MYFLFNPHIHLLIWILFAGDPTFYTVLPYGIIIGQTYDGHGYPVPSEDEYYQQDPQGDAKAAASETRSESEVSIDSQSDKQPMPKESSFFIFSSKNR